MAIRTYKVTLDSKNSIAPEPVFLRQGDKTGAVVIDATLMDNGVPVSLDSLTPIFKANTADGQAVIADSTGFNIVNASSGEFTYQVPSQLGSVDGKIKIAYFSFSDSSGSQSTFNVAFIVEKAADMTQESAKDWVSNLNEIIEQYNQWANDAHNSWEEFVNENKAIIESIDPGGAVLSELIDFRHSDMLSKTFDTAKLRGDFWDEEFRERGVNVKWFGAVGDGLTDDTAAFKAALQQAHDTGVSSGLYEVPTVVVPSGHYRITEQLTMTPWMHLWSLGHVTLESYVADDSLLWIAPLEDDPDFSDYSAQQYTRAPIIGGGETRLLWSGGWTRSKEVGIEIGSRTDLGKTKPTARYLIENLAVDSFYIGMKWNKYHHYLGGFRNCQFEPNTIELLIGDEDTIGDGVDSGENFVFDHCLFSEGSKGFVVNLGGYRITLLSCSLDFIDKVFMLNRGYGNIAMFGGHIENMRKIAVSSQTDASLAYLSINNTTINTIDDYQLYEGTFNLLTDGVKYERANPMSGTQLYLCDNQVTASESNTINQTNLTMLSPNLNLVYNSELNVGTLGLNGFIHSEAGTSNLGTQSVIPANDKYSESFGFTIDGATDSYFSFRNDKISVKAGDRLISGIVMYSNATAWRGLSVLFRFYNEVGDLINNTESATLLSSQIQYDTWFPAYYAKIVPAHAVSVEVQYVIFHTLIASNFYIGEVGLNIR